MKIITNDISVSADQIADQGVQLGRQLHFPGHLLAGVVDGGMIPAAEGLGQQFIQAVIVNPVRRFRKTQTQRIPVQTALLSLREIPCRGVEFPFKPVADRQEKALFQKTAIDRFPCFPGIGK